MSPALRDAFTKAADSIESSMSRAGDASIGGTRGGRAGVSRERCALARCVLRVKPGGQKNGFPGVLTRSAKRGAFSLWHAPPWDGAWECDVSVWAPQSRRPRSDLRRARRAAMLVASALGRPQISLGGQCCDAGRHGRERPRSMRGTAIGWPRTSPTPPSSAPVASCGIAASCRAPRRTRRERLAYAAWLPNRRPCRSAARASRTRRATESRALLGRS